MLLSAVKSFVNLFKMAVGDVGIDLGGTDALMSQHFLDGAEVGSRNQQVSGERMPQGVGADVYGQAAPFSIFGYNPLNRPCGQPHIFAAFFNIWCTGIADK